MRKKKSFGIEGKINENIKVEEEQVTTNENSNPNQIENIEFYDMTTKPQVRNRLTYKK